eukprot:CAMPEP_0167781746 /NCGR_PEP_ID=MMETSP0111_2-20121227/6106_1 /TAXON_ID=91324 /ORGANISM="Lotharella globosa, Strain CCCM811" /LENGTH=516 /DNA_ID=CAMNT_0007672447 /DNA_START=151 /DNA_END=1701 /DNA_ORIENTATION=+
MGRTRHAIRGVAGLLFLLHITFHISPSSSPARNLGNPTKGVITAPAPTSRFRTSAPRRFPGARAQVGFHNGVEGSLALEAQQVWSPGSWRGLPASQQPDYADQKALQEALDNVASLPPLVQHWETKQLKRRLKEVFDGKRFVLQAGDCAETFGDCTPASLEARIRVLEQMRLRLESPGSMPGLPVTVIRRAAGQYGKPRSKPNEIVGGVEMPAFRGENVNQLPADLNLRQPKPERLVEGYFRAQCTMNYLRTRLSSPNALQEYASTANPSPFATYDTGAREVYTSHEGLLLGLEQALTRRVGASAADGVLIGGAEETNGWYNAGAHFVWIGTRTKQLHGAHTEYFRGIDNPIGIKVGSDIDPQTAVSLVRTIDPRNEPGKVVLITRFGASNVSTGLPQLAEAIRAEGLNVVWFVDPMHGNTFKTTLGDKTRRYDDILAEIRQTHQVLKLYGQHLGGIHLELTGEDVTECVGGPQQLGEEDLKTNWKSACDPRLNYEQSLELAREVSEMIGKSDSGT